MKKMVPAGPASVPWEERKICKICGGRYVPGYYREHAEMWHRIELPGQRP